LGFLKDKVLSVSADIMRKGELSDLSLKLLQYSLGPADEGFRNLLTVNNAIRAKKTEKATDRYAPADAMSSGEGGPGPKSATANKEVQPPKEGQPPNEQPPIVESPGKQQPRKQRPRKQQPRTQKPREDEGRTILDILLKDSAREIEIRRQRVLAREMEDRRLRAKAAGLLAADTQQRVLRAEAAVDRRFYRALGLLIMLKSARHRGSLLQNPSGLVIDEKLQNEPSK